jgi:hypothetical protein
MLVHEFAGKRANTINFSKEIIMIEMIIASF